MTRREHQRAEHVRRDVRIAAVAEAFHVGSVASWERRARDLESARPRRGDFTGNATPAEIAARWDRLTDAARACRHRAHLAWQTDLEFADTLDDLAAPYVDLEQQLRAAIDAGDRRQIDRLAELLDQADHRQGAAA